MDMAEGEIFTPLEKEVELGESAMDVLLTDLRKLEETIHIVHGASEIDQDTVASVESRFPGILTDKWPSGGYVSKQTVTVAMEELTFKMKVIVGAIVAAVIGLVIKLITWMLGDEPSNKGGGGGGGDEGGHKRRVGTKEEIDAIRNEIREDRKKAKQQVARIKEKDDHVAKLRDRLNKNQHEFRVAMTLSANVDKDKQERLDNAAGQRFDYDLRQDEKMRNHIRFIHQHQTEMMSYDMSRFISLKRHNASWTEFMKHFNNGIMEKGFIELERLSENLVKDYGSVHERVSDNSFFKNVYSKIASITRGSQNNTVTELTGMLSEMIRSDLTPDANGNKEITRLMDFTTDEGIDKSYELIEHTLVEALSDYAMPREFYRYLHKAKVSFEKTRDKIREMDTNIRQRPGQGTFQANANTFNYNVAYKELDEVWKSFVTLYHLRTQIYQRIYRDIGAFRKWRKIIQQSIALVIETNGETIGGILRGEKT